MNIVITMGGLGSRFAKAGYKVPKYMIEAKDGILYVGRAVFTDNVLYKCLKSTVVRRYSLRAYNRYFFHLLTNTTATKYLFNTVNQMCSSIFF